MIEGALAQRALPDGRIIAVVRLIGGRARITRGTTEYDYDDGW